MGDYAFKIIDLSLQKYAFVCYYLPVTCLPELDGKVCMRPYFEKVLEDLQIIDPKTGVRIEQFGGYLSSQVKHFGELLEHRDREPSKVEDKLRVTNNFKFDLLERLLVVEQLKLLLSGAKK